MALVVGTQGLARCRPECHRVAENRKPVGMPGKDLLVEPANEKRSRVVLAHAHLFEHDFALASEFSGIEGRVECHVRHDLDGPLGTA